jgi:mono/diheme cytochrome c family protein
MRRMILGSAVVTWCLLAFAETKQPVVHASTVFAQSPSGPDGHALYADKCGMCHGETREGNPPALPGLIGVTKKYSDAQIADQIKKGKGRMPAFSKLSDAEVAAIITYLKTGPQPPAQP